MKKLSLLIALILCATIGGVYAAWTYAGTDDIADAYSEAKITITDAELSGANGTYAITSNLVLTIDQADKDHYAKLVFASNDGEAIFLKVTFTPSANAPDNIKTYAVPSEFYFTTSTAMTYSVDEQGNYKENGTAVPILVFSNPSDGNFSPNVTWGDPVDGVFTYTLNENQLKSMITLNQNVNDTENTFRLDTKAEHDAFRAACNGNVVARVTDGKTTA